MKKITFSALVCSLALVACGKKPPQQESQAPEPAPAAAQAPAPAPAPTPAAEPAVDDKAQKERKEKEALMAYASMEDGYLGDARGQWATSAKASSSFSEETPPASPSESKAWRATGQPDGKEWTNNHQDMGMDWLELGYDKPVAATEVRVVFLGDGVEAVSKVELIDTDGKLHSVWSGISDVKADQRGRRTWFVRSFEKTPYPVKGVKVTIANNLERGYKQIDAVQLVGD